MARFRYQLQNILDIKLKLETQAKQEFANAKIALDQQEKIMTTLRRRKREYQREAGQLLNGTLKVRDIKENSAAIIRMDEYIQEQSIQVEIARNKLEEVREYLTDIMKERKTYEKLKEKAFEDYVQEENRQEGKEVDELTSYTYGQRRQVN